MSIYSFALFGKTITHFYNKLRQIYCSKNREDNFILIGKAWRDETEGL
jgi:hypothetical protein